MAKKIAKKPVSKATKKNSRKEIWQKKEKDSWGWWLFNSWFEVRW